MIKGISNKRRSQSQYSVRLCHAPDEHETIYFDTLDHFKLWKLENPKWQVDEKGLTVLTPKPEYPECEKMSAVRPKSQSIGEFIDWLEIDKGIYLAKYKENEYDKEQLYVAHENKETLLAEFFGIDLGKVEDERRAMLEMMSAREEQD